MGFPGRSAVKNQPAMQEMCWRRFDLWVGKIPRRRKWQPIPVILPRKSIDKGAWQTKVHRISNELEMTEQLKKKNNFLCQVLFVCFCFYHLSWVVFICFHLCYFSWVLFVCLHLPPNLFFFYSMQLAESWFPRWESGPSLSGESTKKECWTTRKFLAVGNINWQVLSKKSPSQL